MTPTLVNGVPWLYMDNFIDMYAEDYADWQERIDMGYLMSATTPSPLEVQLGYNPDSGNAEVFVDVLNAVPPGSDYRLFVAVTEDGLELLGPNGEPVHNQAFRWLYPGVEGMPISTDRRYGCLRSASGSRRHLGLRELTRGGLGPGIRRWPCAQLRDDLPDRRRCFHR